ncbi:MAG: hypothetical protein GX624_09375 [Actinobacteria bacterium]|nr:hypothetical protein [Actinomycetota bacterium]
MTIGDVFARAWDLWRRDVGWLILAGLVVGLIMAVIVAVAIAILGAVFAGAGLAFGVDLADDTAGGLSGIGAGMLILGLIVYAVAVFAYQVVGMTFYGGMFEMVLGAYKGNRNVRFGDLFSGFRKFGAYAVFALVVFAISLGLSLLNVIPFIGWIISFVVTIWIAIIWLYVLPLIADQGIGFSEAASRSNQMVKSAGWWWTFGMVILLGIAALVLAAVIVTISASVYRGSESGGLVLGFLLFLLFAVLFPPYAICYVSVLYVASGGDVAPPAAGGRMPGIPPAPPAPPSSGAGPAGPAAPGQPAGDDAWRAAADPLAGRPPAPPLTPPASAPPPPAPPASGETAAPASGPGEGGEVATGAGEQTEVTQARDDEPKPPEPPAPPPPPVPAPPGA